MRRRYAVVLRPPDPVFIDPGEAGARIVPVESVEAADQEAAGAGRDEDPAVGEAGVQ